MKGCEPAPTCRDLPVLVQVSVGAAWIQPMVVWWLTLAESICLAEWFWLLFVPGYLNLHSTPEASQPTAPVELQNNKQQLKDQQEDQDQPQEKNQDSDHELLFSLPCRPPAGLQSPAYGDHANLSARRTSGSLGPQPAPGPGMTFDL